MSDSVILIGGGGHARVVMDCIEAAGGSVFGILDDIIECGTRIHGIPVLGKISDYQAYDQHRFVIAIGNNEIRSRIAESVSVKWATVIHPEAVVSPSAVLGVGSVVMPGTVINADTVIGNHCIINTGAIVEHDNNIGDFAHISPRAALGGTVTVGKGTHIGIGAIVRNNIRICNDCVVGAGAVVITHITVSGTYVGVPAKRIKQAEG